MKRRQIYLALAFLGVLLPYTQFLPWVAEHGLNVPLLVEQIAASRLAAFGWLDIIVSALAPSVLVFINGRERKIPHRWMPIIDTLVVGVSLGLPLYLYLREVAEERRPDNA